MLYGILILGTWHHDTLPLKNGTIPYFITNSVSPNLAHLSAPGLLYCKTVISLLSSSASISPILSYLFLSFFTAFTQHDYIHSLSFSLSFSHSLTLFLSVPLVVCSDVKPGVLAGTMILCLYNTPPSVWSPYFIACCGLTDMMAQGTESSTHKHTRAHTHTHTQIIHTGTDTQGTTEQMEWPSGQCETLKVAAILLPLVICPCSCRHACV